MHVPRKRSKAQCRWAPRVTRMPTKSPWWWESRDPSASRPRARAKVHTKMTSSVCVCLNAIEVVCWCLGVARPRAAGLGSAFPWSRLPFFHAFRPLVHVQHNDCPLLLHQHGHTTYPYGTIAGESLHLRVAMDWLPQVPDADTSASSRDRAISPDSSSTINSAVLETLIPSSERFQRTPTTGLRVLSLWE
jgi:hypothetical protein